MYKTGRERYLRVHDSDAHKNIQYLDERYQILHHAFVYVFDTMMFLVGNKQSHIINGILIDFSKELRKAYGNVINNLKEVALFGA
mmetsp:Transcript_41317/g.49590  ORF Transcript_41317/g.49590 Transcript_41317/m.49590 type:complete len:85 (-) Transcript_41317:887-1141(-)